MVAETCVFLLFKSLFAKKGMMKHCDLKVISSPNCLRKAWTQGHCMFFLQKDMPFGNFGSKKWSTPKNVTQIMWEVWHFLKNDWAIYRNHDVVLDSPSTTNPLLSFFVGEGMTFLNDQVPVFYSFHWAAMFHSNKKKTSVMSHGAERAIHPEAEKNADGKVFCGSYRRTFASCADFFRGPRNTGWWFQPIWKILVKMGIFPT